MLTGTTRPKLLHLENTKRWTTYLYKYLRNRHFWASSCQLSGRVTKEWSIGSYFVISSRFDDTNWKTGSASLYRVSAAAWQEAAAAPVAAAAASVPPAPSSLPGAAVTLSFFSCCRVDCFCFWAEKKGEKLLWWAYSAETAIVKLAQLF